MDSLLLKIQMIHVKKQKFLLCQFTYYFQADSRLKFQFTLSFLFNTNSVSISQNTLYLPNWRRSRQLFCKKKIKQHITELAIIPYHVVFKFLSIPISDLMLLISCESPSASLLNNNIHSILILDDDDVSTSSV